MLLHTVRMSILGLAAFALALGLVAGEWLVGALRVFAGYVTLIFLAGFLGAMFWPHSMERRRRMRIRRRGRDQRAIQCARSVLWVLVCCVAARFTEFSSFWLAATVFWGAVLLVELLVWRSPLGHRLRDAPLPAVDPDSLDMAVNANRRFVPFLALPLIAWVISWWYLTA
ncbi:MAG: hypothetical protein ACJAYX_003330 [Planctomycetota bacterium]|jgi:hypothetical protein